MTDANGRNNSNGRRQRRARLTAKSEVSRTEVSRTEVSKTEAARGPATEGKTSHQKSPVVGRRSRRRRQIAGVTNPPNRLLNPSSSKGARTEGLTAQPSRLLAPGQPVPGQPIVPGKPSPSGRTAPSRATSRASSNRAAGNRAAGNKSAGSVPLSSSLVRRRSRRPKLPKYALSAIWILVGGLGLATIFGTILANRPGGEPNAALTQSVLATDSVKQTKFPIPLGEEIPKLKAELEDLPTLYPGLQFKAFYIDVDTGNYVDLGGREAVAAASTIKLPILLAFFEEVDKGNIDLNQTTAILPAQIAEGSGEMQMSPPGTQFTALEVATQMIVHSDNTATNMMIDLLGGAEVLNERFARYGLEETRLNNPLPDIEGTNTTSARDLVHSMLLVQGDLLKTRSRDRVLNILKRTENKRLLAAGLEEKGALTYNKTGFISKMLGDVALVDLSNGKRYVVSILVDRPDSDGRAVELIHGVSGRTYQYTNQAVQPAVTPLGNPNNPAVIAPADGSQPDSPSASPVDASATTPAPAPAAPFVDRPEGAEDPYPSANPE